MTEIGALLFATWIVSITADPDGQDRYWAAWKRWRKANPAFVDQAKVRGILIADAT